MFTAVPGKNGAICAVINVCSAVVAVQKPGISLVRSDAVLIFSDKREDSCRSRYDSYHSDHHRGKSKRKSQHKPCWRAYDIF